MSRPTAPAFPPRRPAPRRLRAEDAAGRRAEARLIAAAKQGDAKALAELLERAAGPAYRFSRGFCRDPHDTEDLVQDVLATLLRSLGSFRGESSLSTWTYVVARRACGRMRRRGERVRPMAGDDDVLASTPDSSPGPQRRLERRQLGEALEGAIAELPPPQREVLVLRDVEGLSAAEVGEVLGLGERAVKSRLHRARLALRARLAPFAGGEPRPAAGCPDTALMLSRAIEGELSAAVCERMERHVRNCDSCGHACHTLRDVLGACRAHRGGALPREMRAAVKRAVKAVLAARR